MRRIQGLGIQKIQGDIVLDRSAFDVPARDAASFDGEPLRPYNAAPDALLLNFKSVVMGFVPDHAANTAQISYDLPLAGVQMQSSVPLAAGDCGDYRGALRADFSDPLRIRFLGSYPASCGEKVWPVAYADPKSYNVRAVEGLWHEMGGKLTGTVREGRVPTPAGVTLKPTLEQTSPVLADSDIRQLPLAANSAAAKSAAETEGRRTIVQLAAQSPQLADELINDAAAALILEQYFREHP